MSVKKSDLDKNNLTEEEFLKTYNPDDYKHPSLTCDVVVITFDDGKWQALLVRRGGHPFINCFALPGGFVGENESTYQAAMRELMEETSVKDVSASSIGMFSDPGRDPRDWIVTEAFVAKVDKDMVKLKAGDDAREARWFDIGWEYMGGVMKICLTSGDEKLSAKVLVKRVFGGFDYRFETRLAENDGIAFDHACIIANVIARYLDNPQNRY